MGRQGAGKSTIGSRLAHKFSTKMVETSAVVKQANKHLADFDLAKSGERTKDDPNWLGDLLYECLVLVRAEETGEIPILVGVREKEVYVYLEAQGVDIFSIYLTADPFTRYNRLIKQGRIENIHQFLVRERSEWILGLNNLCNGADIMMKTSETTKPQYVTVTLLEKLKAEGIE